MCFILLGISALSACTEPPEEIKVTAVEYTDAEDFLLQGFKSVPDSSGKSLPAVVIIPDWNGVNTYEQQRATMMADDLGYVGFAADIYGINDQVVEDFNRKVELATLYRSNVTLYVQRIKAAVELVKTFSEVDPDRVAVIGYCFGGTGVIDYSLTGQDDVVALVSFHGGLTMLPDESLTDENSPKLLVLSGGDDDASSDVIDLENTLGSANWDITRYSGIRHTFTVWGSADYDKVAEERSWHSMTTFLSEAFGLTSYSGNQPSVANVETVNYEDIDGTDLQSYLAMPDDAFPIHPAVVILPNWDNVNEYEKERATMLAEHGYIALAADLYGADLQREFTVSEKAQYATKYRSDPELYIQRIQRSIDFVLSLPEVDPDNVALIGYCLGGTGVFEYAYSGSADVKVAVSFHGGHQDLPRPSVPIVPHVLVLSGGIDDAHGNQTKMEESLNERDASWEITRYSNVNHGYTSWSNPAYNVVADARSWDSMMTTLSSIMPVPEDEEKVGQKGKKKSIGKDGKKGSNDVGGKKPGKKGGKKPGKKGGKKRRNL